MLLAGIDSRQPFNFQHRPNLLVNPMDYLFILYGNLMVIPKPKTPPDY